MPLFASLTLVKETALKEAACVRLPKYRLPFMVKGLTVTHEFLQIHLTDNLAHLSEHHLGDLTGHLGLIHIEIILRCYLDQFGVCPIWKFATAQAWIRIASCVGISFSVDN